MKQFLHLPKPVRAGFTLIELLAVMLIIGILMVFLVPKIPAAIDRTNVTACKANMKSISEGLLLYHAKYKKMPTESGVGFFTSLISDKVWESTQTNAKSLTCPGVLTGALVGLIDLPPDEWYTQRDIIDGSFSAYAGRNTNDYPIRKYPMSGKEALVADDNDPDGNHQTSTVVLWGDNSVREMELVELQKEGLLGDDEEWIPVGEESPVEALTKLSLD
jgi:prepilin-type N-terminal cleavage/methylation domain-containing protein